MKNTNLLVGITNSGKTKMIFDYLKEIINSGENFIVNDTKEEYYKTFMPTLKENGYKTYLINYKDALNSNGFNPLIVPYKLYKSGNKDLAIDEINNISNELFKNDEAMDPFWQNSASDYFKGLTLLLFEIGKEEEINLGSVGMMLLQAENNKETFDKFKEYIKSLEFTNPIYIFLSGTVFAPVETRGGIVSVLRIELNKYISKENLLNLLCQNELDLNDLKEKKAIFVIGNENTNRLTNILIDQLYNSNNNFNYIMDNIDSLISINSLNGLLETSKINNNRIIIGTRNIKELSNKNKFNIEEKVENIINTKEYLSKLTIGSYNEYPILNKVKSYYFNITKFLNR